MTTTLYWYPKAMEALATRKMNLPSDTFKLMLLTTSYPSAFSATTRANHFAVSDVVAAECSAFANGVSGTASNYARTTCPFTSQGEAALVWTAKWTPSSPTWSNLTFTAGHGFQYVVCYDDTDAGSPAAGDSTRRLIWVIDNGSETDPTAQNVIVTLPAAGTLTATGS